MEKPGASDRASDSHAATTSSWGPLAVFLREAALTEHSPVVFLSINPRTADHLVKELPPRHRSFVVALTTGDRMEIGYPEGTTGSQGFHEVCEGVLERRAGATFRTFFVGEIYPDVIKRTPEGVKADHVVRIFQKPDSDLPNVDSLENVGKGELGKIDPLAFLHPNIAQRLLHALKADRMEVVYGTGSMALYQAPHRHGRSEGGG